MSELPTTVTTSGERELSRWGMLEREGGTVLVGGVKKYVRVASSMRQCRLCDKTAVSFAPTAVTCLLAVICLLVEAAWQSSVCYSLAVEPCLCLLAHIQGRELQRHGHLSPRWDTPTGWLNGEGAHLLPLVHHAPCLAVNVEAGVGDAGQRVVQTGPCEMGRDLARVLQGEAADSKHRRSRCCVFPHSPRTAIATG